MHLDESGDEARHRGSEVAKIPHQMDRRQFGGFLRGEIVFDPRAQGIAGHVDIQDPHHGNGDAGEDAIPMRIGTIVGGGEPRLLLHLACDAAGNIERLAPDVIEIRRA